MKLKEIYSNYLSRPNIKTKRNIVKHPKDVQWYNEKERKEYIEKYFNYITFQSTDEKDSSYLKSLINRLAHIRKK